MRISDWSSDVCSSDLGRFSHAMTLRAVIVTGIGGGIGASLGRRLKGASYFVIGLDRYVHETHEICDHVIYFDLARCRDDEYFQSCIAQIRQAAVERPITALVHNPPFHTLQTKTALTK